MERISASGSRDAKAGVLKARSIELFLILILSSSLPTIAQEKTSVATSYAPHLSGTVVDTSGAVISGATVQVRSANGALQKTTQSDTNGAFIISALPAGKYRLVVSNPGFETKEVPITIGTAGAPAPLRISLAVGFLSTTINVQGRQDDLVGIASSAGQGSLGNADAVLVADCTATSTQAYHDATLANIRGFFGQVANYEDVLADWRARRAPAAVV